MPKIKVNGRINKVNGNNDVRLRVVNKEEHRAKGGNALAVSTNSLAPQAELEPAGQRTRGFTASKNARSKWAVRFLRYSLRGATSIGRKTPAHTLVC